MRIHILGIAGTFMGGVAQLAQALGHQVSGSDKAVYPPMSDQLADAGIPITDLDDLSFLDEDVDLVVIGNAMTRGMLAVEATLNRHQAYCSGPEWLARYLLKDRWVLGVAGTHGKTTTSAMLAWILESAGLAPGFLIGGVPENFGQSARLGSAPFFVVEADEYDTAFFDKRSKFVHYHPRTLVLNNLEFDHADIFSDLSAIQTQFHHLIRTVPSNGLVVMPANEPALDVVLDKGCWTPVCRHNAGQAAAHSHWHSVLIKADASEFEVWYRGHLEGVVRWSLTGEHNVRNGMSAIIAAQHAGVPVAQAIDAMAYFKGVKRRMTHLASLADINLYDDFAHHPTAIATTLAGQKAKITLSAKPRRLVAVCEPRSNTMRMGVFSEQLVAAFDPADKVMLYIDPKWGWQLPDSARFKRHIEIFSSYEALYEGLMAQIKQGDDVVFMSNGSFASLPAKVTQGLQKTLKEFGLVH
ncbi:UDP-N-acetylmuramate:L-alanyl-gamma-D-glutamyl-meso-diaminopimelate ligase [Thiomicrospira aerophila AL3]|uniref:UDP-N-acetylmuramate--L-alanyl-gamma-D-glutamyl-meso-2,6-diaminoheptandioate ligase n=1 Tax=Thiomicrospira aerophila AL3 TaxID=717772 RepID=W0DV18_9GAMM|nr:UDP-N-acetylmuramate:L-alanyl-gamma-D-glutamyl-meso-diaminopimelate ligase [Thiomicrospira aerophila]AHF00696.1 UDP-N-acetylmuramate:L-alanyl-gamma-D-glutamyl-meso-diaminopimelate ligase [Thiomicrospira aerophila AL3]